MLIFNLTLSMLLKNQANPKFLRILIKKHRLFLDVTMKLVPNSSQYSDQTGIWSKIPFIFNLKMVRELNELKFRNFESLKAFLLPKIGLETFKYVCTDFNARTCVKSRDFWNFFFHTLGEIYFNYEYDNEIQLYVVTIM